MTDVLPPLDVRIAQAKVALHELMTGKAVVQVSYDGVSTQFRAALGSDIVRLEQYINKMEAELAGRPRRGAFRVVFG